MNLTRKFLLYTFSLTWISWGGLAILTHLGIMEFGQPVFMILYILGGLSPFIVALISIRKDEPAFNRFKAELFRYRVNVWWYVGILALPLAVSALSWLLSLLISKDAMPLLNKPFYLMFLLIPPMIIGGGLEEVGWRGVLLPQLLKKASPLRATLLTAGIWALWHLPLWFIKGVSQYGTNYLLFVVLVFSLSFILSTIYLKTKSILLCVLFHAVENAYLGISVNGWANSLDAAVLLAVSIAIFFAFTGTRQSLLPER